MGVLLLRQDVWRGSFVSKTRQGKHDCDVCPQDRADGGNDILCRCGWLLTSCCCIVWV